jgi:CHAT domain-containing protein/lipopolysaccharide biosynthesis regulator YciM
MNSKRILLGLLVMGVLAIGFLQVGSASKENDEQLDDICIQYANEASTIEKVLPSISDWDVAFEEDFGEDWDSSFLTEQLDASAWEQVVDDERTTLRVECNCWVEMPGDYVWRDYAFTTSVKIDHGGVTLSFRQCSDGRYFVGLEEGGLFLGKEQPWGQRVTLATSALPIALEEWCNVTIVGIGPELFVFLDGQMQIHYVDDSSPILAGGISYETCGEAPVLLIDMIEVLSGDKQDPQALLDRGYALLDEHDSEAAYQAFAEAVELFRAETNKSGEAEALRYMAKSLISSGDVSAAIEPFQQAIEILIEIGDRVGEAYTFIALGNCYTSLGNYQKALNLLAQARDQFIALGDREGEIESVRGEGNCLLQFANHAMQNNPQEALGLLNRALSKFREIHDQQGEANTLLDLGHYYDFQADRPKALNYFNQARTLFRKLHDHAGEARSISGVASCYLGISEFDQSISLLEQALMIFRSIGDRNGEADSLLSMSCPYESLGKMQEAVDVCEQALDIFRDIPDLNGEASCMTRLGDLYEGLGDTKRAIDYFQQCLAISQKCGNQWLVAESLIGLGHCYDDEGQLGQAIDSIKRALAIHRDLGYRDGEAACVLSLAGLYGRMGFINRAIDYSKQAIALGQDTDNPRLEADALMSLASWYNALTEHIKAIEAFKQALVITQKIGAVSMSFDIQLGLADCYRTLGQLEEAKDRYEQAIAGVEEVFGGLEMETLQSSFFVRVKEVYEEYLHLLLQMHQTKDTLSVAERCRARTFLDLVAENAEEVLKNVPEEGIRTGVVAPETIDRDMHEVVMSLPEDTAALEYFVTNDVTYVWGITEGAVEGPIVIPRGREQLMKKVIECRQQLEATDLMVNRDLAELYDWLIRPVENWLPKAVDGDKNVPHLIIIPSGPLYYLPFQALLGTSADRSEQFRLIERYAVSYSPSLVTLKYATTREAGASTTSVFLGLADPDPGDPALRLPEAQDEANHVAALFTSAQVYTGADATEPLLQQEAQQARYVLIAAHGKFNPQHPMYSYLLLSPTQESDGKLNTYEVFGLGLQAEMVVLSACETLLPAMEEMKEEERLTRGLAKEATVELTEEQLEELTRGDEVAGLTRAFIAAGAASVVSSLWSVPSEATTALMVSLYTHLEEGMSKAGALRAAQLEVLNTAGCTQPWYWAAFNLVGDWR